MAKQGKQDKKVKGLDKEPKKGSKVVHQAADEVSADANMAKAKKALKGSKGKLVAEPITQAAEAEVEWDGPNYPDVFESEILDANEPDPETKAVTMTTYPHGRFELAIPEVGEGINPQQLSAFALREHAIDLSLKPRPTEVSQHVLHNARMSRIKHGDPIMVAAVAATDPSVPLPTNATMGTATGGVNDATNAVSSGANGNLNDGGVIPADIAAMKQPGTNRPLTQGQVLTELLVRAQHKANATGQAQGVVVPRRYTTKNYGLQLMKTFGEADTDTTHGVKLHIVNHSDEFVPDTTAKGGGGFQITLTVEPDPQALKVPKGMEPDGTNRSNTGTTGVSAKIEPQDVHDVPASENEYTIEDLDRDLADHLNAGGPVPGSPEPANDPGVKLGKKDKAAKLGKGKSSKGNVVDLNSIKARKRG